MPRSSDDDTCPEWVFGRSRCHRSTYAQDVRRPALSARYDRLSTAQLNSGLDGIDFTRIPQSLMGSLILAVVRDSVGIRMVTVKCSTELRGDKAIHHSHAP